MTNLKKEKRDLFFVLFQELIESQKDKIQKGNGHGIRRYERKKKERERE